MEISTDKRAVFSFGVIADIQYADIDDKLNYAQTKWRRYRQSLVALKQAVQEWNSQTQPNTVSFVLQLGDVLDGFNTLNNDGQDSLRKLLREFAKYHGPVHHIWGNHELYNFTRTELFTSDLNSSPYRTTQPQEDMKAYYDFYPHEKFCFIILDTYEIGVLGYEKDHPVRLESEALLMAENPNEDKRSSDGMHGLDQRLVCFNGGLSREQLQWLDQVLAQAQKDQKWVVICGHQPIYGPSTTPNSLCWCYDKVLAVLHKYSCTVAYLAGHQHDGGAAVDDHGIHHITFHGVVEGEVGQCDFGTLNVYEDKLELVGRGRVLSKTIALPRL